MEKTRLLPRNPGPQMKHVTSIHIQLQEIHHVVTSNSKESKKMLSSYMPRKKREKTSLSGSPAILVPPPINII